jgi:predicted nucleotidyltransferase
MKSYGLSPSEIQDIKKLLHQNFGDLDDAKAFLFGSRAKGNYKPFSDIDIAIRSKSPLLSKKITLFKEDWERSKLPYKVDITSWKEIYKPYLSEINKSKKDFWKPLDRELHPWRACPYGEHWGIRHPRYPVGRKLQDVDGHCRKNPSGKDYLKGDEIDFISKTSPFQNARPLPCPYQGKAKIPNANEYDVLIAGWCKYWNDILRPQFPLDPNFVKALIESETHFRANISTPNKKKSIGPARGLIQMTEETWRTLKNPKGEIKDYYVQLDKDELFEPSKNICAGIRWIFRKKEMLQKRIKKEPSWTDVMLEYKGIYAQFKKNGKEAKVIHSKFVDILSLYKC